MPNPGRSRDPTLLHVFLVLACVAAIALSLVATFAWREEHTKRRARELAQAAEARAAATRAAELPSVTAFVEGITVAHPTTAPRNRLLAAIAEAGRGAMVCSPLVIQGRRANWFYPHRIDELAVLLIVSDSIEPPIVEWRRREQGVAGRTIRLLAEPTHNPMREGVTFLLFKEYFAEGLVPVADADIPRPAGDEWLKQDASTPYNDFANVEVRVRSALDDDGGVWHPVESLTAELSARVSEQWREAHLPGRQRYARPQN